MVVLRMVAVAAAVVLLVALGSWPYGYYLFLRVVVFAAGLYCGIQLWHKDRSIAVPLLICAAIFNPLIPAHLNRGMWEVLNVLGAGLFGFTAYRQRT